MFPILLVCDIDGTISDNSHRAPTDPSVFASWDDDDWTLFYSKGRVLLDQPVPFSAPTLRVLSDLGQLVYLTGRDSIARYSTIRWLGMYGFPVPGDKIPLYTRSLNDRRPSEEFKKDRLDLILKLYGGPHPRHVAIDDESQNREMLRSMGFEVFSPSPLFWRKNFETHVLDVENDDLCIIQ